MNDQRVGAAFRVVRIRRGWRQSDVASRARVSPSLISLVERGHTGALTLDSLRRVAATLDIRLDVLPRWRGGDLDRLLNSRHAALTESVAAWLTGLSGWVVAPEVSFSVYGERGSIDLLAWHAASRTLLVIEVKTEIVDLQELLGVLDRKTRLARRIGQERGWIPVHVATWLVIAEGTANRRRVSTHEALVRSALPRRGPEMRRWLTNPVGPIAACSFWSNSNPGGVKRTFAGPKRVRRRFSGAAERGSSSTSRSWSPSSHLTPRRL